jgi:hypothetical protein
MMRKINITLKIIKANNDPLPRYENLFDEKFNFSLFVLWWFFCFLCNKFKVIFESRLLKQVKRRWDKLKVDFTPKQAIDEDLEKILQLLRMILGDNF